MERTLSCESKSLISFPMKCNMIDLIGHRSTLLLISELDLLYASQFVLVNFKPEAIIWMCICVSMQSNYAKFPALNFIRRGPRNGRHAM